MLRQRLLLVSALYSVACAQIAGFDHLSSRTTEAADGGSSAGGAGTAATGGKGSASAGHGSISGGHGGALSSGGNIDKGGSGAGEPAGGSGSTTTGGSGASSRGGAGGASSGSGGLAGSTPSPSGGAANGGAAGGPVIGGCDAELLTNANFEAGPASWREESTAPGILAVSDLIVRGDNPKLIAAKVAPYAGNYLAWLGGTQDTDKGSRTNLLQDVQIPQTVSRLVLSGWIQIQSTEPDPNETTDQLDLTLQDEQRYWSFHFWKGTELTNGWKPFSYEFSDAKRLDALRGRTLTFYAESIADTSEITSYWLDSLSLFAECAH